MSLILSTLPMALGARPVDPDYRGQVAVWVLGSIVALVVIISAVWRAAVSTSTSPSPRASLIVHAAAFLAVGAAVATGVVLTQPAPSKVPAWSHQVTEWAAHNYGVQAGASQFADADEKDCLVGSTPCYEATVLLSSPTRVARVQLAYPSGIPLLLDEAGKQLPTSKSSSNRPPLLRIASKTLGKDLTALYDLPGNVDIEDWRRTGNASWGGQTDWGAKDALGALFGDPRSFSAGDCVAAASNCAVGTVLWKDQELHRVELVAVDDEHAILVDPKTGEELPRATHH